jgi:hypothetical protein
MLVTRPPFLGQDLYQFLFVARLDRGCLGALCVLPRRVISAVRKSERASFFAACA